MTQLESIKMLPRKFQTIGMIRSMEVKTKLADLILTIDRLINDAKGYQPDPTTLDVVGRYYGYLLDTCRDRGRDSVEIINRRSMWMLHYGQTVQHYLLLAREKRFSHNVVLSDDVNDRHLVGKIEGMIKAIGDCKTSQASLLGENEAPNQKLISTLDQILQLGKMIQPDLSNPEYISVVYEIEQVTWLMSYLKQCATFLDMPEEFIVSQKLFKIDYLLRDYSLRGGFRQG